MMQSKNSGGYLALYTTSFAGCASAPLCSKRDSSSADSSIFSPLDRIHALDGADADLNVIGGYRRCSGGERHRAARKNGCHRLACRTGILLCLLAQRFGIHQKQDASHSAELEQTIRRGNRGKGFARAGGHLHQCFGTIFGKGSIQVLDCGELACTESSGAKGRKMFHVIADGIRLHKPCLERFRLVKAKDGTGTVFHILIICEARQLTGCLIGKSGSCNPWSHSETCC